MVDDAPPDAPNPVRDALARHGRWALAGALVCASVALPMAAITVGIALTGAADALVAGSLTFALATLNLVAGACLAAGQAVASRDDDDALGRAVALRSVGFVAMAPASVAWAILAAALASSAPQLSLQQPFQPAPGASVPGPTGGVP